MVIKNIFKEISMRHKDVHGKKGSLEKTYQKIKQKHPNTVSGKIRRIAGIGTIDLSWFLFCLGKYTVKDLHAVFLNNKIIDKLQTKKENITIKDTDSKFKQFFKNLQKSNPRVAATLHLWMLYTLFAGMAVGVYHKDDIKESGKNIIENVKHFFNKNKKYNPKDSDFKQCFVDEHWNEICIGILEFETYRTKPKLQGNEPRYTYGPGLTWVYVDGKQHPCLNKYKNMAENFSESEVWNQVRQHCLYSNEVMDKIQKSLTNKNFENVSSQQVLGLFCAGYQTPAFVNGIVKRLYDAGHNQQKIIDAFIVKPGNMTEKYREGTNKRRWWCAMIYIGKITADDLLQMDRDAFSKVDINVIMKDGHFVCDDAVIDYALSRKKSSNGTVQDYIAVHDVSGYKVDDKDENIKLAFNAGIQKIKKLQHHADDVKVQFNNHANTLA